jgi:hypothetical protein
MQHVADEFGKDIPCNTLPFTIGLKHLVVDYDVLSKVCKATSS